MPILFPGFPEDEEIIEKLAERICTYWNSNGGADNGFTLYTSVEAIRDISREGDRILAAFFPEEPGPFKRVATLLVLSRLESLFILACPTSTEASLKPAASSIQHEWGPRICFLLVEPTFRALRLRDANGKEIKLDRWRGFPSLHSKAEFLLWLQWLCDYPPEFFKTPTGDDERLIRRGRMILATSLILEAVYYQGEKPGNNIPGLCDDALKRAIDLRLVLFDAYLRWNELQKLKHPPPG